MLCLRSGDAAHLEPMVRLLVQVQLPQKESQLPTSPSAAKQQSSAPRSAVSVSIASIQIYLWGPPLLGIRSSVISIGFGAYMLSPCLQQMSNVSITSSWRPYICARGFSWSRVDTQ